jgi:hypothetical protein
LKESERAMELDLFEKVLFIDEGRERDIIYLQYIQYQT